MRKLVIASLTLCLTGCYANWPELDQASKSLTCEMDVLSLDKLAKRYQARGEFDALSNSYSITKFDDGIGIAFNDKKQIMTIAKTKSLIGLGGLTRKQGDVLIVKRCIKQ